MRSPIRIQRILAKLAIAWNHNCPDQRLGQFLSNLALPALDLWNIEDTEWEKLIDDYTKTGRFRS